MARFSHVAFVNNALNCAPMELFLNLVWLAIAAGALLSYLYERIAHRKPIHLGLAALACALVFLLPAISITDDLHVTAFSVEDASLGKRLVQGSVKTDLSSHVSWLPVSFQARPAILLPWTTRTHIAEAFDFLPTLHFRTHLLDRAPPLACA